MPRRGRSLELLVARIQELNIPNVIVTSPEFVKDVDTGELREVDVGVRLDSPEGPIFIALECRDRGAVQDSTWIEQLVSKKRSVAADVLIAVTSSSFSAPARTKAFKEGIRIRNIESFSADELLGWVEETYVEIHSVSVVIDRFCGLSFERSLSLRPNLESYNFYSTKSNKTLSLHQFIDEIAIDVLPSVFPQADKHIPNHGDKVSLKAKADTEGYYLLRPMGNQLILQRERITNAEMVYHIEKVVDRYPASIFHKYMDSQNSTQLSEVFEYGKDEGAETKVVIDSKTNDASLEIDLSNLNLHGRVFRNLTIKCIRPVSTKKFRVKL